MRGGTSKGGYFLKSDLPADKAGRDAFLLGVMGSPDPHQIDGMGGADPLTSKLAIIGPVRTDEPRAAGTHLTYTFGQVEIAHPEIDWLSLCGNISSAVGAFAIDEGYVAPSEPMTQVRVFNSNGAMQQSFFAYDPAFTSGISVSAGQIGSSGPGRAFNQFRVHARILQDLPPHNRFISYALRPES